MADLKMMRELRYSDVPLIGTKPTRQLCVGEKRYLALLDCAEALEEILRYRDLVNVREAAREALAKLRDAP
jgi:hypothetical protein